MPQISARSSLIGPDVSDALEWVAGDAADLQATYWLDEAETEAVDLTEGGGATITLKVEFYTAKVRADRTVSPPKLDISKFVLDSSRAARTIPCPLDANHASAGRFTIPIPADLLPGDDPPADTSTPPVGLAYLTRDQTIDGSREIRTDRFLIVFRRGAP